jgi:hypothetical protein
MIPALAVCLVLSAPAPQPKAERWPLPRDVWLAGTWAGQPWEVKLIPENEWDLWGGYHGRFAGQTWGGMYRWFPVRRELHLVEFSPSGTRSEYRITLGRDLHGKCADGVKVSLGGKR